MGGYFIENFHVVNGLAPVADAFATAGESDIINLENYAGVVFLIMTGVSTTANGVVTVQAGTSVSAATNAVPFVYRKVLAPATTNVAGALTAAEAAGFAMTASKANSFYLVEVKAEHLAPTYTTVKCVVTEDTNDPQTACIVAIAYGGRYGAETDAIV
jgi:hypothetical protein